MFYDQRKDIFYKCETKKAFFEFWPLTVNNNNNNNTKTKHKKHNKKTKIKKNKDNIYERIHLVDESLSPVTK